MPLAVWLGTRKGEDLEECLGMTNEQLIAELKKLNVFGSVSLPEMEALLDKEGGLSRIVELLPEKRLPRSAGSTKISIPDDFPDAAAKALAIAYWETKRRPDLVDRVEEISEQCHDHHTKENSRYPRENWRLVWKTWYVNAVKFEKPPRDTGLFAVAPVSFEQTTPQGWVGRLEVFYGLNGSQAGSWSPKWRQKPDETGNCIPQEAWRLFEAKHPGTRRAG